MKRTSHDRAASTDLILVSLAVVAVLGAGIALSVTGNVPGAAADVSASQQPPNGSGSGGTTTAPDVETKALLIRGSLVSAKLNSDLEMEILNVTAHGRTVIVRHTLGEGFTREESIGIMLGTYENTWNITRAEDGTWRVRRIEGEIVGTGGDVVAEYHVRRVWLEDLYRGRISRFTFSEQVMDTVSETDVS